MTQFSTPILLLEFNRPDYFLKMIDLLRPLQPKIIFIHRDGPRSSKPEDQDLCNTIEELVSKIDWKCQIKTFFSKQNLGCKNGVNEGISWFFSKFEEGIILEDDCLPDLSFFDYCEELLEKYRNETKVGMIAGSNFFGKTNISESYFFSKFPQCWGWATWKRAWQKYDVTMKDWPAQGDKIVCNQFSNARSVNYWQKIFAQTFLNKIDTWDYQWVYTCWKNKWLCIVPQANLVSNIGFDARATHTIFEFSPTANQKSYKISLPLQNPSKIDSNQNLDDQLQAQQYQRPILLKLGFGLLKLSYKKISK